MTTQEMNNLTQHILDEVRSMRSAGQKEYAHNKDNVFANFDRVGNLLEVDRKKVLMTYMLKHIDGIAAYVKGHKSQREDVTGRITDCMVYLMLLWGMIEEEDGIVSRKKDDSSVFDVLTTFPDENIGVSVGGGRSTLNGLQANGDMQKVCQAGSGIEKSQEVGTT